MGGKGNHTASGSVNQSDHYGNEYEKTKPKTNKRIYPPKIETP